MTLNLKQIALAALLVITTVMLSECSPPTPPDMAPAAHQVMQ